MNEIMRIQEERIRMWRSMAYRFALVILIESVCIIVLAATR